MAPRPTRLSRRDALALLLAICAVTTLQHAGVTAAGGPRIHKLKVVRWLANHRFRAQITYPQLSGLPDAGLERRVNALLQALYPAGGLAKHAREETDDLQRGEEFHLEGEGKVTLLRKNVVSVRYTGLEMAVNNGRMIGAHPNNRCGVATVDLQTGKAYGLGQLFTGTNWRSRLDTIIAKQAVRQVPELAQGFEGDGLLGEVREHRYHCWLTPRGVGVGEIFVGHAVEGVEVVLPLAAVRDLLDARGPGRVLLR